MAQSLYQATGRSENGAVSDGSRILPVAPVESATAVIDEGAMPSNVAGAAGMCDQASQFAIDAEIAKHENASPKERTKGERYARAFEFIVDQPKAHGKRMQVYRRAGEMAGLGESHIRELWKIKRIWRYPRGMWPAVLTPHRSKRKSFVDSNPEIAAVAAGVILERRSQISDVDVWRVVRAKFEFEDDRHQEAVERWCRRFRKIHRENHDRG
jgi:hypothetical protein